MEPGQRQTFMYLADGRVFIRRDNGPIAEAQNAERIDAAFVLGYGERGVLDPTLGLALIPPVDN